MKSTPRLITIAILACSLVLPLSACGSDDAVPQGGGSTESTTNVTENDPTDAPEASVENVLASMSADEIEAKLQAISVDGQSLTIPMSHQELTDMSQTLGGALDEMVKSMTVEPVECLEMAQEAQKIQKPSAIEFAVAANTADNSISVLVEKASFDVSASIDNMLTYAAKCPDVSIEIPSMGLKSQLSQTATSSSIPPFSEGVILTQDQKTSEINSSMYSYYGADPENGLFVLVNAPATSPSTDDFEALVADIIRQLNTQ